MFYLFSSHTLVVVNGVKIMHFYDGKEILKRHIGSNMEALFKVVYHSLCLFIYIQKNKKPLIYMFVG